MIRLDTADKVLLLDLLREARQIVTVTHTHPDGDAVGSSLGIARTLQADGRTVRMLFPDPVPDTLAFMLTDDEKRDCLVHSDSPALTETALAQADLIFCLDFNAFSRTEGLQGPLAAAPGRKILIDHHLNPVAGAFDLCISQADISSASELVFWVLDRIGARLPLSAATALMTGMTTDTNNFANSTWPSTFEMASRLLTLGVDRDALLQSINQSYEERRMRAMGELLEKMVLTPEGAAYMILDAATRDKYGLQDGDTEGFVNLPLSIRQVRLSIFIKEEDSRHFRVSLRSKQGTSANTFARKWFHGGGHEQASGGKLFIPDDIPAPSDAAAYLEKAIYAELS